jgi:hypothetical protein
MFGKLRVIETSVLPRVHCILWRWYLENKPLSLPRGVEIMGSYKWEGEGAF